MGSVTRSPDHTEPSMAKIEQSCNTNQPPLYVMWKILIAWSGASDDNDPSLCTVSLHGMCVVTGGECPK